MSIAWSQAVRDAIVERPDPHCIAWGRATASLWGMSRDHDLDEPVRVSDEFPVRLRISGRQIIADRELRLQTARGVTHLAVRFYFKDGSFKEADFGTTHMTAGEVAVFHPTCYRNYLS